MMIFNCLTLFPEMFSGFVGTSLCARAIQSEIIEINLVDYRRYTMDKHRRVDDYPFGGGAGMLIAPQPVFDCFDDLKKRYEGRKTMNIYMSAAGRTFDQKMAKELSRFEVLNVLCGHYEGVDQRIIDECIDEEISIGDYVLTGGEIPAMVLMDSVMRFAGVLGSDQAHAEESHYDGLLEYPQYTRPADFRGRKVPEVLISGHHANIASWQREMSLLKTALVRPDLLKKVSLSDADREILKKNKIDLDFKEGL
jgi:tRNA (guanine37-N1)-methyltransferase